MLKLTWQFDKPERILVDDSDILWLLSAFNTVWLPSGSRVIKMDLYLNELLLVEK